MMKRYTLEEYLLIDRWESEREAAQEPYHPQTPACLTPTTLDDYRNGAITLDEGQLDHLLNCRRCAVRFGTLAELTLSEVKTKVEKDLARIKIPIPPMVTQVAPSRSPSPAPLGVSVPRLSDLIVSRIRSSPGAAAQAVEVPLTWHRASGETVEGWLMFEPAGEGLMEPHVQLKPAPKDKPTLRFRYEGGTKELELTLDRRGHSQLCEGVPEKSLPRRGGTPRCCH